MSELTSSSVLILSTIVKAIFCIVLSLQVPAIMVWVERRQCALIQRRVGPNRVGFFNFRLFGLGQSLADAVKMLFKEDFVPSQAHKFFYLLAPVITSGIALTAFSGIPFGSYVMVGAHKISLQVVEINSGFLYLLALSSLGVYGVTLAGWSANSKYTLLGGMRASAQMISYEIAMGMSLVPLVFIFGTLDLQKMIMAQSDHLLFGFLPAWGIFYAPISFLLFLITMFAETNRLPFDLAEGESELIAGFHTEHGSMRFALFFLGEYVMMFVLSAFAVCMFLGGYEIPYLPQTKLIQILNGHFFPELSLWIMALIGVTVLLVKVAFFMLFFVQVRWTLPRFRYDQLMQVGWEYLIPIAIVNLVISAVGASLVKF